MIEKSPYIALSPWKQGRRLSQIKTSASSSLATFALYSRRQSASSMNYARTLSWRSSTKWSALSPFEICERVESEELRLLVAQLHYQKEDAVFFFLNSPEWSILSETHALRLLHHLMPRAGNEMWTNTSFAAFSLKWLCGSRSRKGVKKESLSMIEAYLILSSRLQDRHHWAGTIGVSAK